MSNHYITVIDIKKCLSYKKQILIQIFWWNKRWEACNKKTKAAVQVSDGVGKYTYTKTLMNKIEEFCKFTGGKNKKRCQKDEFSIKIRLW